MTNRAIELDIGYYHLTYRAGIPEEEFARRTLHWSLPLEKTALILVDVWGEHFSSSYVKRAAQIATTRIKPVLETFRNLGATVVHAPSPDCAQKYAQWGKYAAEKPAAEASAWPPAEFRSKSGDCAQWARPTDPQDEEFDRIIRDRYIQRDLEPRDGDEVIADGEELQRLLQEREILFLFYAGFAANMCLQYRDYGMRAMKSRGYEIICIEDCTTGVEVADTVAGLTQIHVVLNWDQELLERVPVP